MHRTGTNLTPDELRADRGLGGILGPDVALPAQLLCRPRDGAEPERRLMAAILEQAIRDLRTAAQMLDGRPSRLAEDARAWIERTDRDWLFSFVNVCAALGYSAPWVRAQLRADGSLAPTAA